MADQEPLAFKPADLPDEAALAAKLNAAQQNNQTEFTAFRLRVGDGNPSTAVNFAFLVSNPDSKLLPPIEVIPIPQDATEQTVLRQNLTTRTAIAYSEAAFANGRRFVLIAYSVRSVIFDGKMSHFGGKDDHDMAADEGLAIVNTGNFTKYKKLFVGETMGGSIPLGRNLDPGAFYLACRWNRAITPYDSLFDCQIFVRNPSTGDVARATAVDFGPGRGTGRASDLSPGLEGELQLQTNDRCIVTVYLTDALSKALAKNEATAAAAQAATTAATGGGRGPLPVVGTPPADVKSLTEKEVIALFDDIRPIHEMSHGDIEISATFRNNNIITIDIPQLATVPGAPAQGHVECHRLIAPHLKRAFSQMTAEQLALVIRWDGLFVPRHILHKPSKGLSLHSWGIAFDINEKFNGFDAEPAPLGAHGSVEALVPIFEANGFFWGGRFSHPDGMHFQWGRPNTNPPV